MRAPNILLVVSDQERQRDWLPDGLELPHRRRLIDGGLEFTGHYTHTSPCSPSRATLFTGQYMAHHGVTENSTGPGNTELPTTAATLGHLLRAQGYETAYKGKWHLQVSAHPDMEAYGFSAWEGNDMAFWGLPGSGTEFDEPISRDAGEWIRQHRDATQPWFLAVGLVNPHDIMWFPLDQTWFWERERGYTERVRGRLNAMPWGRADNLPGFPYELDEWFSELPANFDDDLHTKPDVHRRWMDQMVRYGEPGVMGADDTELWLRQLDYYVKLHQLSDESLGRVLAGMDDAGAWDNTIVIFTSDHGDQCGSHRLRSKGPWNYQETMRIPLYVVAPGLTSPATRTDALTCHMDLARTVAELGGVDVGGVQDMLGESLLPLFADQEASIRDHVLFAQEWPWYPGVELTRYASSGVFDGRYKYCRYYGVGGGHGTGGERLSGEMLYGRDADFDEHEHELYDLQEDPNELVNLAHDRGRRTELRQRFAELRAVEHAVYGNGY